MKDNNWKKREGVVYSTKSDFSYDTNDKEEQETLDISKQRLKVLIDKKQRKGKLVSIVTGFVGTSEDLQILAKELKTKCATGGSAKDGEIIIQGDKIELIKAYLGKQGYNVK